MSLNRVTMTTVEKDPTLASLQPKNILFAADFSRAPAAALAHAIAFARSFDARLFLVHVVAPDSYPFLHAESIRAIFGRFTRDAERRLRKLSNSEQLREIPHELLLERCPSDTLSEVIRKHDIELVVLSTGSRRGFNRLLLRSAAAEIFRNSSCPLLAVGPNVQAPGSDKPGFRHILYPTERLEQSLCVAPYAISIAARHSARLTVLHALREHSTASLYRLFKPELDQELERLIPQTPAAWRDSETLVEYGEPAETILRIAKVDRADLIVLGVTQRDIAGGHFEKAVIHRVIAEAESPVLAFRGEPFNKPPAPAATIRTEASLVQAPC